MTNFLIIKPSRCTNSSNLFWNETLHVSDSSSVHHQELFIVHTAMVYDTSVIITNDNKVDFRNSLDFAMIQTSNWFRCNLLTLNYDKTYFLQFLTFGKLYGFTE